MYIVIEGQDGAGKSTQVRLLRLYYEKQGREVAIVDEPDGDLPQAHELHDLILVKGKEYDLEPMTNLLLFTAARMELWQKVIEPTLWRGGVVISARNWWSTLAYQSFGEGIPFSKVIALTKEVLPRRYIYPTRGVILAVSDTTRKTRQDLRGKEAETFEVKADDFQKRVNDAYLEIARRFKIPIIDASGSIDEVSQKILQILEET